VVFLVSVAAAIIFLIACYQDIRHRTISNAIPLAVAGAAIVKWIAVGQIGPALWALAAAAVALAISAFLFAQGWLGGGDVKLLSAAILLIGAPATPLFLVGMALIGGVIAAAMMVARAAKRAPADAAEERPTVPYGVAIAVAAVAILALEWREAWSA